MDLLNLYSLDQLIPVTGGDYQICVCKGTVQDLYNTAGSELSLEQSLNALNFPHPHAEVSPSSYASDVQAFSCTWNEDGCSRTLPTPDMRWGIRATAGAHHYWHLDSQGEGTSVFLCCGEKLWIVTTPKDPKMLSETKLWHDLNVTNPDENKWTAEMILLQPGHKL
ncbi:hypothetical protein BJ165DRAFT_1511544 [Panaeolus papilionaceus]|nr:hypothetical protein BJ165DRAFT_1511544 [Panaeolus papilionaceus]